MERRGYLWLITLTVLVIIYFDWYSFVYWKQLNEKNPDSTESGIDAISEYDLYKIILAILGLIYLVIFLIGSILRKICVELIIYYVMVIFSNLYFVYVFVLDIFTNKVYVLSNWQNA
jgi:hypothetical protein